MDFEIDIPVISTIGQAMAVDMMGKVGDVVYCVITALAWVVEILDAFGVITLQSNCGVRN